jgi:hypothetical protein
MLAWVRLWRPPQSKKSGLIRPPAIGNSMGMVAVGSDLCRAAPPKEALRATPMGTPLISLS